jgi:hypothetical protein
MILLIILVTKDNLIIVLLSLKAISLEISIRPAVDLFWMHREHMKAASGRNQIYQVLRVS